MPRWGQGGTRRTCPGRPCSSQRGSRPRPSCLPAPVSLQGGPRRCTACRFRPLGSSGLSANLSPGRRGAGCVRSSPLSAVRDQRCRHRLLLQRDGAAATSRGSVRTSLGRPFRQELCGRPQAGSRRGSLTCFVSLEKWALHLHLPTLPVRCVGCDRLDASLPRQVSTWGRPAKERVLDLQSKQLLGR